jgi:hypothetical protein
MRAVGRVREQVVRLTKTVGSSKSKKVLQKKQNRKIREAIIPGKHVRNSGLADCMSKRNELMPLGY